MVGMVVLSVVSMSRYQFLRRYPARGEFRRSRPNPNSCKAVNEKKLWQFLLFAKAFLAVAHHQKKIRLFFLCLYPPPAVRSPSIACNPNYRGKKLKTKKNSVIFFMPQPHPPVVHNPNYRGIACKKFLAHTPATGFGPRTFIFQPVLPLPLHYHYSSSVGLQVGRSLGLQVVRSVGRQVRMSVVWQFGR